MSKKPSPLTGNHVAKELKKHFRKHGINYTQHLKTIVAQSKTFPPLVFNFQDGYINIYNINDMGTEYSFPCSTITQLFIKLLQYRLVRKQHIDIR